MSLKDEEITMTTDDLIISLYKDVKDMIVNHKCGTDEVCSLMDTFNVSIDRVNTLATELHKQNDETRERMIKLEEYRVIFSDLEKQVNEQNYRINEDEDVYNPSVSSR